MRVFPAEQEAGLSEPLGRAIAYVDAAVVACRPPVKDSAFAKLVAELLATATTDQELPDYVQPDLAWIRSILVSAGWNLNDDVFTTAELWKAKDTPCHKPINLGHDEHQIVGHLVESRAVDKTGNELGSEPQNDFDLEVNGVLYERLLPEAVASILNESEEGTVYVSMECWFDDLAYALKNPTNGDVSIVPRTADTAYLTKHLRAYGGSGDFQGVKIGRVLKGIRFAGKGIVHTPANPDSVIKEVVQPTVAEKKGGVQTMPTEAEQAQAQALAAKDAEIKSLTERLAAAETAVAKLTANETAKSEAEAAKVAAETAKTAAETQVKELEAKVTALTNQVTDSEKKVAEANQKLDEIAKTTKASERLAKLKAVGNVADEAQALKDIRDMSDEAFATVLRYAGKPQAAASETTATETAQADADEVLDGAEPDKSQAALQVETKETEAAANVALAVASRLLGGRNEQDDSATKE